MLRRLVTAVTLLYVCGGPGFVSAQTSGATPAQTPAAQPAPQPKNDYSNGDNWLCRPGRHDACAVDLSTTIIAANGKLKQEAWAANAKAPVDCFYVYPTVSTDATGNSDMIPGPEEKAVVRAQFARFA